MYTAVASDCDPYNCFLHKTELSLLIILTLFISQQQRGKMAQKMVLYATPIVYCLPQMLMLRKHSLCPHIVRSFLSFTVSPLLLFYLLSLHPLMLQTCPKTTTDLPFVSLQNILCDEGPSLRTGSTWHSAHYHCGECTHHG